MPEASKGKKWKPSNKLKHFSGAALRCVDGRKMDRCWLRQAHSSQSGARGVLDHERSEKLFPDSLDDSRLSDQSGKEEASRASNLLLYKRRLADRKPANSRVRETSYQTRTCTRQSESF